VYHRTIALGASWHKNFLGELLNLFICLKGKAVKASVIGTPTKHYFSLNFTNK